MEQRPSVSLSLCVCTHNSLPAYLIWLMRSGRFSQLDICSVLSRGLPRTCCTSKLRPFSAEFSPTSTSLGPLWVLLALPRWIYKNRHTVIKLLNIYIRNIFGLAIIAITWTLNDLEFVTVQGSRQYIVELLNSPSHLMSCHNILFQPDIPCDFEKYALHSSHPATCSLLQQMVKQHHQLPAHGAISTFLSPLETLSPASHISGKLLGHSSRMYPGLHLNIAKNSTNYNTTYLSQSSNIVNLVAWETMGNSQQTWVYVRSDQAKRGSLKYQNL